VIGNCGASCGYGSFERCGLTGVSKADHLFRRHEAAHCVVTHCSPSTWGLILICSAGPGRYLHMTYDHSSRADHIDIIKNQHRTVVIQPRTRAVQSNQRQKSLSCDWGYGIYIYLLKDSAARTLSRAIGRIKFVLYSSREPSCQHLKNEDFATPPSDWILTVRVGTHEPVSLRTHVELPYTMADCASCTERQFHPRPSLSP
jgi:hypothetical protein